MRKKKSKNSTPPTYNQIKPAIQSENEIEREEGGDL